VVGSLIKDNNETKQVNHREVKLLVRRDL